MNIQQHMINMISDGTGQMVSKVSKLFKKKKTTCIWGALTGRSVSRNAQYVSQSHLPLSHSRTLSKHLFSFSPHKKGLMHIFNQVLPVFQVIQFPREATWNTCFHISKLHLLKCYFRKMHCWCCFTAFQNKNKYQNVLISKEPITIY